MVRPAPFSARHHVSTDRPAHARKRRRQALRPSCWAVLSGKDQLHQPPPRYSFPPTLAPAFRVLLGFDYFSPRTCTVHRPRPRAPVCCSSVHANHRAHAGDRATGYPGSNVGPEPTTDRFVAIMHGPVTLALPVSVSALALMFRLLPSLLPPHTPSERLCPSPSRLSRHQAPTSSLPLTQFLAEAPSSIQHIFLNSYAQVCWTGFAPYPRSRLPA